MSIKYKKGQKVTPTKKLLESRHSDYCQEHKIFPNSVCKIIEINWDTVILLPDNTLSHWGNLTMPAYFSLCGGEFSRNHRLTNVFLPDKK